MSTDLRAPAVRSLRPDDPVTRVRAALAEIAAGRPVVVVDDEDREDEGDLVFAAELATPQLVAFTVRHTSGFVCVAVTADDADRLDLPPMARDNRDRFGTAYCVTVDAADGVGTGISARDRARTIQLLGTPATTASDLVRPGHIVPLRAQPGGVLRRPGHTEAALDLATLAGLAPAAALCEIVSTVNPAGMARGPELSAFAREHGLQLITIADLVAYRLQVDVLVDRIVETAMPTTFGAFTAVGYRSLLDGGEHLALVHGNVGDGEDVLVHVHEECPTGDALGGLLCGCGPRLRSALAAIAAESRGVVVYLRGAGSCCRPSFPRENPAHALEPAILRDLGIRTTRSALDDRGVRTGTR